MSSCVTTEIAAGDCSRRVTFFATEVTSMYSTFTNWSMGRSSSCAAVVALVAAFAGALVESAARLAKLGPKNETANSASKTRVTGTHLVPGDNFALNRLAACWSQYFIIIRTRHAGAQVPRMIEYRTARLDP